MPNSDPTKGSPLYGNITDIELNYLPDDMCVCGGCGLPCYDASDDGDEICEICLTQPRTLENDNDR